MKKLLDLIANDRILSACDAPIMSDIEFVRIESIGGRLCARLLDNAVPIKFKNVADESKLVDYLKTNATILASGVTGTAELLEFYVLNVSNEPLDGITVSDTFRKFKPGDELADRYVIATPTDRFIVKEVPEFSIGAGKENKPFALLGENNGKVTMLDCLFKKTDDDTDYIFATRERDYKYGRHGWNIEVARVGGGDAVFSFETERTFNAGVVARRNRGKRAFYLEVWERYNKLKIMRLANAITKGGLCKINGVTRTAQGYKVTVADASARLKLLDAIKETKHADCVLFPSEVDGVNATAFSAISTDDDVAAAALVERVNSAKRRCYATVDVKASLDSDRFTVILSADENIISRIGSSGYLCISGRLEYSQLKNQLRCFDMIMNNNNPMPRLSEILLSTDDGNSLPGAEGRNYIGLADAEKYFISSPSDYPPRPRQVEALRAALRTPDIALIWGPPGTGKTSTIKAIMRAIEKEDRPQNGSLLTAYQHEALDNMMERVELNGLPCLRYGGKKQQSTRTLLNDNLIEKISDIADRLSVLYPEQKTIAIRKQLKENAITITLMQRTYDHVCGFARKMYQDCLQSGLLITTDPPMKELNKFIQEAETLRSVSDGDGKLRHLIHGIRLSKVAYDDDGIDRLNDLRGYLLFLPDKSRFEKYISDYEKAVRDGDFESAVDCIDGMSAELFGDKRCTLTSAQMDKLGDITDKLSVYVDKKLAELYELEEVVLSDYAEVYKTSPSDVLAVLKRYNKASGVTHNQLDNKAVQRDLKNSDAFENVIIDEAARSSPMDLFVVMSRASKRIILVGDHCQLAQFVDKDEFREAQCLVEGDESSDSEDISDVSLFRMLMKTANKLTEKDGVQRIAQLDEQYRMPEALGTFVSDRFYNGSVKNGRSDHSHNFPGYIGKSVVYANIPYSKSTQTRQDATKSSYRASEAKWIADDIKRLLGKAEGVISVGVISFYNAQCKCIRDTLCDNGVMQRADESGEEFALNNEYIKKEAGEKERSTKLYIGTVDSFQGREFDVVYLSLTASYEDGKLNEHMMSVNRQCVAMSRAKKLMIVVGDEAMARSSENMAAYVELCRVSQDGLYKTVADGGVE